MRLSTEIHTAVDLNGERIIEIRVIANNQREEHQQRRGWMGFSFEEFLVDVVGAALRTGGKRDRAISHVVLGLGRSIKRRSSAFHSKFPINRMILHERHLTPLITEIVYHSKAQTDSLISTDFHFPI